MNPRQIIILIVALIVSVLIVWYDLPIEIPFVIFKVLMLTVKMFLVWAAMIVAFIFAGREKGSS